MKFVYYTLLSAWAAAAASEQPGRSSFTFNFEDGLQRDLKKTIVSCDPKTEETCYDETYTTAVSCALISDGGCPCPEGQERCGADLANGCVGWCTDLCCDWTNEYACYGDINFKACATYGDGCPCPEGQSECYLGFCSNACCDMSTEEYCYGPDNTSFCAPFADGGCPCPDGQERCGAETQSSGWCAVECCDSYTEETCFEYDDGYSKPYTNQYCAAIVDGGCPCPGDQVKCDTDLSANYAGWCADVCCDYNTEETCYNPPSCALIADGGCPCPAGQERCGADLANNNTGWCADDCCDLNTEEICYNYTGCISNQYCAAISDGGCPCPDGTERCGADLENNVVGWCDVICCDAATQETCYEYYDNGTYNGYCAAIADGGCPCPDGTERCGADLENNVVGWCDVICCDMATQETCYDWESGTYNGYCAAIADGGCPCPDGTERCGADLENNDVGWCDVICCNATTEETCYDWASGNYTPYCAAITNGGCPKSSGAVSYLHYLEAKYDELPAIIGDNDLGRDMFHKKFALKQKIEALRHSTKLYVMPAELLMSKNPEQYIREKK
ncbi:hypothetical protein ACHAW5_010156 [Stephanodiscus triporus]|uniref:Uncharacterized protein n=1 Tax=Stephanodiscus triporus TaxID=2934178 RepID=A0ABD3NJ09_9STRA